MTLSKIDYELNSHYEFNEGNLQEITQVGYTIKFNTDKVIEYVKENLDIIAQKHVLYRFEDPDQYNLLRTKLSLKINEFIGILGDDAWPLYQIKFSHINYWNDLYGENWFEKTYPKETYGTDLWNKCEDLIIIKKHDT